MEGVTTTKGHYIGDVDPGECGGWFATLVDESKDHEQIAESFHAYKRDAVAWLRREWKNYKKSKVMEIYLSSSVIQ